MFFFVDEPGQRIKVCDPLVFTNRQTFPTTLHSANISSTHLLISLDFPWIFLVNVGNWSMLTSANAERKKQTKIMISPQAPPKNYILYTTSYVSSSMPEKHCPPVENFSNNGNNNLSISP